MNEKIRVQPAPARRQEFAQWAVAQAPKIRTCSGSEFAVPAGLFADAPEQLLIGALVDGHRYVPVIPDVEPEPPHPPPSAPPTPDTEWQPPLLPEQEAIPGEPLPELPDSAYGPDAVLLEPAPLDDRPSAPYACGDCDRTFNKDRGLAMHRRQAHPESATMDKAGI
jgi:hypothetical protein